MSTPQLSRGAAGLLHRQEVTERVSIGTAPSTPLTAFLKQARCVFGDQRFGEKIPLRELAARFPKSRCLFRRFNTLGNQRHFQTLPKRDDGVDNISILVVVGQVLYERPVNFQGVTRKTM